MAEKFHTIVADPPWAYKEGWPSSMSAGARMLPKGATVDNTRRSCLPYSSMTLDEIQSLPVAALAEDNAHLYLWTTNRYLRLAFDVVDAWGFRYSQTLVWAKTPMGMGPGGAFVQNVEYIIFARRGKQPPKQRVDSAWFNWKRTGKHSKKPEAFQDMVELVSPGPYLEMFARRQRLGWSVWGNEVESDVTMVQA